MARTRPTLLADYAALFKLRVSTMVLITAGAGFYLGSLRSGISPFSCRSRASAACYQVIKDHLDNYAVFDSGIPAA